MYAYALECNRRLRVSAPLRCLCVQEVHLGVSQNRRKSAWETPCTQVWAHLCISEIEMHKCATDEIGRPVPFTCVHCFAQGEKNRRTSAPIRNAITLPFALVQRSVLLFCSSLRPGFSPAPLHLDRSTWWWFSRRTLHENNSFRNYSSKDFCWWNRYLLLHFLQ